MTLNEASATSQLEAAKLERKWFVEAEKFFKKNHPQCWQALNAINKPSQVSGLLRLLDLGRQREDELLKLSKNKENCSLRLMWAGKTRKQLVFVPYETACSVTRTFLVAYEFLPPLGKFDGVGSVEEFGEKWKGIIQEVLNARRKYVRPYLSSYQLQLMRNRISAQTRQVLENQRTAALEWCGKDRHVAPGALAAPEPAVGVDAARAPCGNPLTPMNQPLTHGNHLNDEPHTPKRRREEDEQNVDKRVRPNEEDVAEAPQLPPMSLPNSQGVVGGAVMVTGSLLRNEPQASWKTGNDVVPANPISSSFPSSTPSTYEIDSTYRQVTHNKITSMGQFETAGKNIDEEIQLNYALQRMKVKYPQELIDLMRNIAPGGNGSELERFIRACEYGTNQGPACKSHRCIVKELDEWVLEAPFQHRRECTLAEIESVAKNRVETDIWKAEKAAIQQIVLNTVNKCMEYVKNRQDAVRKLMSTSDINELDEKCKAKQKELLAIEAVYVQGVYIDGLQRRIDYGLVNRT